MSERHELPEGDAEIERRARAQGWVPEAEWDDERAAREGRRKPERFVSPAEYLEQSERSLPIMRQSNRELSKKVGEQSDLIRELNSRLDELGRMVENVLRANKAIGKREYERGMAEARQAKKDAIAAGDEEAVDKADAAIAQLEELKPDETEKPRKNGESKVDPAVARWAEQSTWFNKPGFAAASQYMIDQMLALTTANPGKSEAVLLPKAEERVKAKFPELFEEGESGEVEEEEEVEEGVIEPPPPRRRPSSVSAGRGGRHRPSGRTWNDVPAQDRADYEKMAAQMKAKGVDFTREEFLAGYRW